MKFPIDEYKEIFSKVPRLAIEIVVKDENNKILLTKRDIYPKGEWHIPGCTLFVEESLDDAISRVAKEELNVKVKFVKNLGFIDWFKTGFLGHPISLVFETLLLSSKDDIKLDFQASDWGFFDISNLPKDTLKEHKDFLCNIYNNS